MSYTPEQLDRLAHLTLDVMTAAIIADRTGPVSALRELIAGGDFFATARERYLDSPLILQLVERISAPPSEETPSSEPEPIDMAHREQEYAALVGKVADASALLRDDHDLATFKRFLIEMVEAVVQASGTGLFGSGERVTPEEQIFIRGLKAILGVGGSSE